MTIFIHTSPFFQQDRSRAIGLLWCLLRENTELCQTLSIVPCPLVGSFLVKFCQRKPSNVATTTTKDACNDRDQNGSIGDQKFPSSRQIGDLFKINDVVMDVRRIKLRLKLENWRLSFLFVVAKSD